MMLQMNEQSRIENPRDYAASVVDDLRNLLTVGTCARRDPRRENFYELENGDHTFYIHISPINGNVVLLAKWLGKPQDVCIAATHLAA